ncbi:MAG: hypothetical protein RLZZ293_1345 [Pseudomonadota bacterium]|jgi:adenosylhomocysteine nucleosidase
MKLALICAMDEELAAVEQQLNCLADQQQSIAGCQFKHYTLGKLDLTTVVCGIGKVNAALVTQILCSQFNAELVINVGVAGGVVPWLNFGDVVIASDLVQHDIDVQAFGLPLGQIPRLDTFSFVADKVTNQLILNHLELVAPIQVVNGRIISGDQFIDDASKVRLLAEQFNALACEMEGAAIAQVCYLNQVKFAVIRCLSDRAGQDGEAIHSYSELKDMAASRAALVIKTLVENLEC